MTHPFTTRPLLDVQCADAARPEDRRVMPAASSRVEATFERWATAQRIDGIAESTIEDRRRVVARFAAETDPLTATSTDVVRFLACAPVKARTRATYRSYLNHWFRYVVTEGLRADNPVSGSSTVRRPPGIRDPRCRDPLFPVRWRQPVAEYSEHCRAAGHSAGTIRNRVYVLSWIARTQPDPWLVTHRDLVAYLSKEGWSPATRRSKSMAVRSFFGWADANHRNPREDPSLRLPKVIVRAGCPRPAPSDVVRQALARADARGRLMLLLAAHAGLRRSEIASVHSGDVVDGRLRVTGKGGKTRVIPLSSELADAIASRCTEGYLFPGQIDGHLSADRVAAILCDLLGAGWTAHTLRHAFATKAYAAERDLFAVQQLLGHASPQTTAIYAAVPSAAMERAVAAAAG